MNVSPAQIRGPWRGVLCSIVLAIEAFHPCLAADLSHEMQFHIPPQNLDSALVEFSRQSKVQVIGVSSELRNMHSEGTTGLLTISDALKQLLRRSGLSFRAVGETAVSIGKFEPVETVSSTQSLNGAASSEQLRLAQAGSSGETTQQSEAAAHAAGANGKENNDRSAVSEIIVTAQKREERILDVPLSVSAITNEMMKDAGSEQLADFLKTVPGVGIVDNQNGLQTIVIRGIAAVIGDTPIGYYLDEMPFSFLGNTGVIDVRAYDLERVEVLRGPQGTLYGDGSIGGTIRVLTRNPDLKSLQGDVDLTGMNTTGGDGSYIAKGMLNLPIKEGVAALRLVAAHEDYGGWIDSPLTGEENRNTRLINNYRAKLRLAPTDNLDVVLSAWRTEQDVVDANYALDDGTSPIARSTGDFQLDSSSLAVNYDFGGFNLLSATSYLKFGLNSETVFFGLPFSSQQTTKALSEELRLTSDDEGIFRWTGGVFYRKLDRPFSSVYGGVPNNSGFLGSRSWAVFGEGTWAMLGSKLNLTLGLRYFEDERARAAPVDDATLALVRTVNPDFSTDVDSSFRTVNPRFNVAFHVNDNWMLYTNVAKGFRSGQIQGGSSLILATLAGIRVPLGIDSESLWSYEIGAKGQLAEGRMSLEGAVFRNDWESLQLNRSLGLWSALLNGGTARTRGIELAAVLRPLDGLDIRLSMSRLNAEYTESVSGINVSSGDRIGGVPETGASATATYRWPVSRALTGFIFASAQYTSDAIDLINTAIPSDDTTAVDMRLGIEGQSWGIYLLGQNLTDENGAVGVGYPFYNGTTPRMRPRTYGVNARYSFR